MAAQNVSERESFLNTIVSVAAPLIQIIAVTSVSLSDQLQLSKFFEKSEYLPLVNVLIIFVILSIIGILVTKSNILILNNYASPSILKQFIHKLFRLSPPFGRYKDISEDHLGLMKKLLWLIQIPSFILFLMSIIIPFSSPFSFYRAFLQYFFYFLFLVSSGVISFMWLQDFQRKKNIPSLKDYYPNVVTALRMNGLLSEKDVILKNKKAARDGISQVVRVTIENEDYILITDLNGNFIVQAWKIDDAPEDLMDYLNSVDNYIPGFQSSSSLSPSPSVSE